MQFLVLAFICDEKQNAFKAYYLLVPNDIYALFFPRTERTMHKPLLGSVVQSQKNQLHKACVLQDIIMYILQLMSFTID